MADSATIKSPPNLDKPEPKNSGGPAPKPETNIVSIGKYFTAGGKTDNIISGIIVDRELLTSGWKIHDGSKVEILGQGLGIYDQIVLWVGGAQELIGKSNIRRKAGNRGLEFTASFAKNTYQDGSLVKLEFQQSNRPNNDKTLDKPFYLETETPEEKEKRKAKEKQDADNGEQGKKSTVLSELVEEVMSPVETVIKNLQSSKKPTEEEKKAEAEKTSEKKVEETPEDQGDELEQEEQEHPEIPPVTSTDQFSPIGSQTISETATALGSIAGTAGQPRSAAVSSGVSSALGASTGTVSKGQPAQTTGQTSSSLARPESGKVSESRPGGPKGDLAGQISKTPISSAPISSSTTGSSPSGTLVGGAIGQQTSTVRMPEAGKPSESKVTEGVKQTSSRDLSSTQTTTVTGQTSGTVISSGTISSSATTTAGQATGSKTITGGATSTGTSTTSATVSGSQSISGGTSGGGSVSSGGGVSTTTTISGQGPSQATPSPAGPGQTSSQTFSSQTSADSSAKLGQQAKAQAKREQEVQQTRASSTDGLVQGSPSQGGQGAGASPKPSQPTAGSKPGQPEQQATTASAPSSGPTAAQPAGASGAKQAPESEPAAVPPKSDQAAEQKPVTGAPAKPQPAAELKVKAESKSEQKPAVQAPGKGKVDAVDKSSTEVESADQKPLPAGAREVLDRLNKKNEELGRAVPGKSPGQDIGPRQTAGQGSPIDSAGLPSQDKTTEDQRQAGIKAEAGIMPGKQPGQELRPAMGKGQRLEDEELEIKKGKEKLGISGRVEKKSLGQDELEQPGKDQEGDEKEKEKAKKEEEEKTDEEEPDDYSEEDYKNHEEKLEQAVKPVNELINKLLNRWAIVLWTAGPELLGLPILLGAVGGDLLWAFKGRLAKWALKLVPNWAVGKAQQNEQEFSKLGLEVTREAPLNASVTEEEVASRVKFDFKVKMHIIDMNLVVLMVFGAIVWIFSMVMVAGCNLPHVNKGASNPYEDTPIGKVIGKKCEAFDESKYPISSNNTSANNTPPAGVNPRGP